MLIDAGEVVHAAAEPGRSFLPCCDRRLTELPPTDRVSRAEREITCGRLSASDELLLTGEPFVTEHQNSEQLLFQMAVTVCTLGPESLDLARALRHVQAALTELVPVRDPREFWPAGLLVRITGRALELAAG